MYEPKHYQISIRLTPEMSASVQKIRSDYSSFGDQIWTTSEVLEHLIETGLRARGY